MAWSMRTPPACRRQARSAAIKGANPPVASARGENVVSPQFWPLVLNKSGGAPICSPTRTSFCLLQAELPPAFVPTAKSARKPMRMPACVIFCCAAAKERSAIHCRNEWKRISRSFSPANSRTALLCGSRQCAGQFCQFQSLAGSQAGGVQGFEQRVFCKCGPVRGAKLREILAQRRADASRKIFLKKAIEKPPEHRHLLPARSRPIDQFAVRFPIGLIGSFASRFCNPRFTENGGGVGVKRIIKNAARWRIWTEMIGISAEQGVHRAQRQYVRFHVRCRPGRAPLRLPYRRCRSRRVNVARKFARPSPRLVAPLQCPKLSCTSPGQRQRQCVLARFRPDDSRSLEGAAALYRAAASCTVQISNVSVLESDLRLLRHVCFQWHVRRVGQLLQ